MLLSMGLPRCQTVLPGEPGFYHCICRCVRRAWLCGVDPLTGFDLSHRRGWIEGKALELAEIFAVSVYAYAVMSNHMHLVVSIEPMRVESWTDEEIAERWSRVTTRLSVKDSASAQRERDRRREALLDNPVRLLEIRTRLGSLSWFMRVLNESIARAANREDGCTGRFWEGRFGCKALRDETAVLGCMTYVDLNPVRAAMANTLEESDWTSVKGRCQQAEAKPTCLTQCVEPMAGPPAPNFPSIQLKRYLELVDHSGREMRSDKDCYIVGPPPAFLKQMNCTPEHWHRLVTSMEAWFGCAVGAAHTLAEFAQVTGRQWVKGVSTAW
jgi:REP element-mobilizing transposase RayT